MTAFEVITAIDDCTIMVYSGDISPENAVAMIEEILTLLENT